MIFINKRKFLTELGKLLTFMYEEDRQEALDLYENMFDDASDEEALVSLLASPTKQAVMIARSYNAKERRLSIHSQSGNESAGVSGDDTPEFIEAINEIYDHAEDLGIIHVNTTRAGSLFDDNSGNYSLFDEEAPEKDDSSFPILGLVHDEQNEPLSTPESESAPAEEKQPAEEKDELADLLGDYSGSIADAISDFLNSSAVSDQSEESETDTLSEERTENAAVAGADTDTNKTENNTFVFINSPKEKTEKTIHTVSERTSFAAVEEKKQKRTNVPLLILYIILAVPITAIFVLLLLIPTIAFLACSAVCGYVAVKVLAVAFGGFAVFADIMMVIGGSLVLVALALLFFWIFIWFIVTIIAGTINLAIQLGARLCCKEDRN